MRWDSLLRHLRALWQRQRVEQDLDEELASHLELEARKLAARGMSMDEARRAARVEFGGFEHAKEQCRDVDRWQWIDTLARNLRLAFRSLVRTPGFSLTAILILAIGIGSNLAVFSLLDSLLLRPLPLDEPSELVRIASVDQQGRFGGLPSTLLDALQRDTAFRGLCGFDTSYETARTNGVSASIGTLGFTGDCFQALGIRTQLGRTLAPADDQSAAEKTAVITAWFWRNVFGGQPDVLGKRIEMPGATYTVVGVAEERFQGLLVGFPAGIIIPLRQEPSRLPGGKIAVYYWVNILARRAPGISTRQARANIEAQTGWLLEQSVPHRFGAERRQKYLATKLTATPAASGIDYFLRSRFGEPLYAIGAICVTILIIACVNLASLLARSLRRRREVAMRLALGVRRAHVAGMLALESSILVLAGTICGMVVALQIDRAVLAQGANMFSNFSLTLGLDSRAVAFVVSAALVIGAAFALAVAWQTGRLGDLEGLKTSGRGMVSGHGRTQRVLLASQIALTVTLVAGASLFGSSLLNFYRLDLGITTAGVWDVTLSSRPDAGASFPPGPYYHDLLRRVESMPGVSSAALADCVPFYNMANEEPVAVAGAAASQQEARAKVMLAADSFFRTVGIRILAGEGFRRNDETGAEPSIVVSESLAARFGAPRDLVGRYLKVGTDSAYQRLKVVGIASNARLDLVDPYQDTMDRVYVNLWQHADAAGGYPLLIQTSGRKLDTAALRRTVDSAGREYVERIRTLDSEKDGALVENWLMAYLAGAFGVIALVLAATGLFGLLSYQVASRTGEIGIRMALGARRVQIQWLIVRQIVGLVAAGSAAGIGLSLLVGRAATSLLLGVSAYDSRVLVGSVTLLTSPP